MKRETIEKVDRLEWALGRKKDDRVFARLAGATCERGIRSLHFVEILDVP